MITKILFIGDPHFMTTNIPEVELFSERVKLLAREQKPDLIIVGGDLLHTHERLHTTPLNKAYKLIDSLRKISKTYVLTGNHDMINNRQHLSENHWMNGMKEWDNTIIVDKVLTETINGNLFVFIPYVYPGRFQEALNTCEEDWKGAKCIFAHQEFAGCKMGAIVSIVGDKWPVEYPQVVSGHIHSNQTPQKNVYYPGSALQHAFGESSKNIIAILEYEEKEPKYKLCEVNLKLPRKKIVYMDIENFDDYKFPETEDKIKITISGNYDQFKALKKTKKYKRQIKEGIKIVFKPKKLKKIEETEKIIGEENNTTFSSILNKLVHSKQDSYLFQSYEIVVNSNKVETTDVFYIQTEIS